MAKFRLNRRAVLRGAGTIAIGMPFLEIMEGSSARAQAATTTPKRFLAVFQPGGTVHDDGSGANKWRPTGTETAPVLSPILASLQPMMDAKKLLIVDGLDMTSKNGEQHQAGIIAWLTGNAQQNAPSNGGVPTGTSSYAASPSVDQVLATKISSGKKQIASLEMAVRWGTGKAHGLLSPISCANFEDNMKASPIAPRIDPVQLFKDLFGSLNTGGTADPAVTAANDRRKSILDHVVGEYNSLIPKLGTADRMTLQQHLDKLRELEMGLSAVAQASASCAKPMQVDTSGYNPGSGICGNNCGAADTGANKDIATDTLIPKVGTYMMDMMVMALACDLTAVGTFQWSDTEAKHTFPWLNLSEHHHYYQHDGGFRAAECQQIATWYSTMHLHLLQAMDKVIMGADNHTLLDETVVFFGSEISQPPTHTNTDMPFMLAGGGTSIKGGRWVRYTDKSNNKNSHNNLLVSILNMFGDTRTTFGNAKFCSGPLTNLA
jgi:hypothetical protein